jgi:hypothetical protein
MPVLAAQQHMHPVVASVIDVPAVGAAADWLDAAVSTADGGPLRKLLYRRLIINIATSSHAPRELTQRAVFVAVHVAVLVLVARRRRRTSNAGVVVKSY